MLDISEQNICRRRDRSESGIVTTSQCRRCAARRGHCPRQRIAGPLSTGTREQRVRIFRPRTITSSGTLRKKRSQPIDAVGTGCTTISSTPGSMERESFYHTALLSQHLNPVGAFSAKPISCKEPGCDRMYLPLSLSVRYYVLSRL